MAIRSPGRDDQIRRRIIIVFMLILACYLTLVARLIFLQLKEGGMIREFATIGRCEQIPLRAQRGSIYDRDGRPLAVSLYSGSVGFDTAAFRVHESDAKRADRYAKVLDNSISRAAAILGMQNKYLADMVHQAVAKYADRKHGRFITIRKNISIAMAQSIRDARPKLLGFGVVDGSLRNYSSGEDAAQVVGFLASDNTGAAGLERSCAPYIKGADGYAVAEVDQQGREIPGTRRKLVPAHDGLDIHTTIDANAQHIAWQEASKVYDKYHPKGISVVAVDPTNGDVLALVSLPSFDPNPGRRSTLTTEALAERCSSRLYEPGSTLKALTVAAALDNGTINEQSMFYCPGTLTIGNKRIHCAMHGKGGGHGQETPIDIMRHSCNVGAAEVGMKMGPRALYEADRRFGLFDRAGVGLPAEQRGRLSFDRNEKIYTMAKAARVSFGHSITTTPLHVTMAYASLTNGGILMKPRLVASVSDGSGKVIQTWKPQVVRRTVSNATAQAMCRMLRAVVTDGTGKAAAIPGYQVGGKTGTANKYRRGAYVGSFIGFVPASPNVRPRVVILVAVDEPQGGVYYGAEVAAPVFQAMGQRLMDFWQVPKDDPMEVQARTAAANSRHQLHVTAAPAKV